MPTKFCYTFYLQIKYSNYVWKLINLIQYTSFKIIYTKHDFVERKQSLLFSYEVMINSKNIIFMFYLKKIMKILYYPPMTYKVRLNYYFI